MTKPELGTKRLCAHCGVKFYDLHHSPITCPKCGGFFEAVQVSSRLRPQAARAPVRAAWLLYTAIGLPALGRIASREWAEVGRFLGPSIRGFYERHPLERIVSYWHDGGLCDIQVRRMSLGGGVVMSARKSESVGDARYD